MSQPIITLKKRAYFLAANASGLKAVSSTVILQAAPLDAALAAQPGVQLGYTVTKKLGNAVVRNRIKRRFREAARQVADCAPPGHYYVLIGRAKALDCDFTDITRDLRYCFARVLTEPPPPPRERGKTRKKAQ